MSEKNLPIKFFAIRENIDEHRTEGGGSGETPKWVLTGEPLRQRAVALAAQFDSIEKCFKEQYSQRKYPFVFRAKIEREAISKSRRREISNLFATESYNNIIALTNDIDLIVRIDSLDDVESIKKRFASYEQNSWGITCVSQIERYTPTVIRSTSATNYKVKLLNFQNDNDNSIIHRSFQKYLTDNNISFTQTKYSDMLDLYKLQDIAPKVLDSLINDNMFGPLFSIEPMPQYCPVVDDFSSELNIEVEVALENQDYKILGILDNGISDIPHLAPWITKRWSPYPDAIDGSHGTFVSGVALYGDYLENNKFVGNGKFKLLDAAVFPANGLVDEDELIQNIQDAVKTYHSEVKIWNLSLSISKEISMNRFSDFAIALDNLQDTYGVLICKSAGNCKNFSKSLPKGKLHHGADSVRSIVVGSVAHKKSKNDFAEKDYPSPFSRIGPGPSFIIKPDVAHYGGNAGISPVNGDIVQTGVRSFGKDGKILTACGTSFSTPRVAALATDLYQRIDGEFDPLLIKALIIHSAMYPDQLKMDVADRTNQMGFGIPATVDNILYNSPNEMTLILRDSLPKGEFIDIMEFPMPQCLITDNFYQAQIIATLVYDPIIDPNQGAEYCQSNLDVKFGTYESLCERDTAKNNILNPIGRDSSSSNILRGTLYSKLPQKDDSLKFTKERLLMQYGDKYYPVKKYGVDLSEMTESNKRKYLDSRRHWFLKIEGVYRDFTEKKSEQLGLPLSQDFCLILTIRSINTDNDVYTGVTQQLDRYNFWHQNINLRATAHIDLEI